MSKTNLGKVSICPKGKYDSTVTYQPLDMVSYNGGSFIARTECTGIEPTAGEVWQEVTRADKEYALIEETTLTEDTAEIVRTKEPDGTPYKFDGCTVIAYWGSPSSAGARYISIGYSIPDIYLTTGATTTSVFMRSTLLRVGTMWIPFGYYGSVGSTSTMSGMASGQIVRTTQDLKYINRVRIYRIDGVYPANTLIRIYAIRKE